MSKGHLVIHLSFVFALVNMTTFKSLGQHHQNANLKSADYVKKINDGSILVDTLKGSPLLYEMSAVKGNHIHIEYSSPGVKGRIIWGGLVPYNQVWVTGAHNATTISFSKAIIIGGKKISAGTYGFFTIPGKTEWIIIFNKRYQQHLTDEYNSKEDVVRVKVKPTALRKAVPRLVYKIVPEKKDLEIQVAWELVLISVPVKLQ